MSLGECGRVVVKSVCSVFLRLAPTIYSVFRLVIDYLIMLMDYLYTEPDIRKKQTKAYVASYTKEPKTQETKQEQP